MRLEERRTLLVTIAAGVIAAILFMPAVYFLGLWLAPPRPVPAVTHVPPLLGDAIWARIDGGRATELRPINPLNFVQMRACRFRAAATDDPALRSQRRAECMKILPAIQAADYLSGVHMQDSNAATGGFREGISQFATAAWVTRSWTRAELLDTLAERGGFGAGWRGVEQGARGYFGRAAAELSLDDAALLAALLGDRGTDPWCDAAGAKEIRGRILERMRDNLAIDDTTYRRAVDAPLELAAPPESHKGCGA